MTQLALELLARGDFARAWPLWESRGEGPRALDWNGEDLNGRSIVVTPEHDGLGDHIQFARWLPYITSRGAGRVLYTPPAPLTRLFRSIPGITVVDPRPLTWDEICAAITSPVQDPRVRAFSLPRIFGARADSIPQPPYLCTTPSDVERWLPRLPHAALRVGLVWRGGPENPGDPQRSLPGLATLAPLSQVPKVAFVSLQKGAGEDEARAGMRGLPMTHLGSELRDFADTAAILKQLDLLISVDTSTAHLAGALGMPVWLLLANSPDWRWREVDVSRRWYPSVRLFRQTCPGDWSGPVEAAAQALKLMSR